MGNSFQLTGCIHNNKQHQRRFALFAGRESDVSGYRGIGVVSFPYLEGRCPEAVSKLHDYVAAGDFGETERAGGLC